MARKRSSSDGGVSLDSLMDALTNVVAVLILVLILVQADVSRTVQKFIDDLLPATPQEVAGSKRLIEDLERKKAVAEARLREKPATPEDIAEEKRQIALLEKSAAEHEELLADLDQVRRLEKAARAERDEEGKKSVALQKDIARLEALLDATPAIEADTPAVVKIPNSRPIPEEAETYYALAARERLHFIDPNTIIRTFKREFERRKGDWIHTRLQKKGKADTFVYDPEKIAAHFKDFNWGNTRGQKVEIVVVPTGYYMLLVIRPNLGTGGTALADLAKPEGEFAKAVPVIRQSMRSVLLFRVHPDSFKTYLAARELTERVNISAGWQIETSPEFRMGIPGLTVKRLKEPPPSNGGGPAKPGGLKPRLD